MEIKKKSKIRQRFCRHEWKEGILSEPGAPMFSNLSGDTYTTICVKCGKIARRRFVPNFDGS